MMLNNNIASLKQYWDVLHEIVWTIRDQKSTLTKKADLEKEITGYVLKRLWNDAKSVWTNYGCFNEIYMEVRPEIVILIIAKEKVRKGKEAWRMVVSAADETLWGLAQVATDDIMNEEMKADRNEFLNSALAREIATSYTSNNSQAKPN